MSRWKKLFLLLLPLTFSAGCARVQPYRPEPIDPASTLVWTAATFSGRHRAFPAHSPQTAEFRPHLHLMEEGRAAQCEV